MKFGIPHISKPITENFDSSSPLFLSIFCLALTLLSPVFLPFVIVAVKMTITILMIPLLPVYKDTEQFFIIYT